METVTTNELAALKNDIDVQINEVEKYAKSQGVKPSALRDGTGAWLMTPLLAAKAQVALTLALMGDEEESEGEAEELQMELRTLINGEVWEQTTMFGRTGWVREGTVADFKTDINFVEYEAMVSKSAYMKTGRYPWGSGSGNSEQPKSDPFEGTYICNQCDHNESSHLQGVGCVAADCDCLLVMQVPATKLKLGSIAESAKDEERVHGVPRWTQTEGWKKDISEFRKWNNKPVFYDAYHQEWRYVHTNKLVNFSVKED